MCSANITQGRPSTQLHKAIKNLSKSLDGTELILDKADKLRTSWASLEDSISFDATSFNEIVGEIGVSLKQCGAYRTKVSELSHGLTIPRLVAQASRLEQQIRAHNTRLRYLLMPLELYARVFMLGISMNDVLTSFTGTFSLLCTKYTAREISLEQV